MMDSQAIVTRLTSEYGYSVSGAQVVADKLHTCDQTILRAFKEWWETGELPELTVEGYSVSKLIKEHNMKAPAAFLTLDWLLREPEKAKASLRKGHDKVTIPKSSS